MIPFILTIVGGYLIGDSMKDSEKFADGGGIHKSDVSKRIAEIESQRMNSRLKKDLQEFSEIEFYEGEKYSNISVSCDLAKGNCYDISQELYDFLNNKGYEDLYLVEAREPLFDLSDAHYEWKVTEYSDLYHIMLKVNDYFIDFTGIQYAKEDIGLKIYTEEQLKKRWGKISFFDRNETVVD